MSKKCCIDALALELSTREGASIKEAKDFISAMFSAMSQGIAKGERIEIRGFGSFSTKMRNAKIGRNPKTGASVNVPAKPCVHFKPSQEQIQIQK